MEKTAKTVKKTKKTEDLAPKKAPVKKVEKSKDGSFAVLETGGKQYRVSVGDTIKTEIINEKEYKSGDVITFDKVLLVDNGAGVINIGTPYIAGASVIGTIASIGRDKKITVIKYKQKSRYFKKNGHRQPHFMVTIDKII